MAAAGAPGMKAAHTLAAASLALLVTLVAASDSGSALAPPSTVQLQGACQEQCSLNGLIYDLMGRTMNGSPYYKARGRKEYLYYDTDCSGSGDGTPRWILDNDAPLLNKLTDLDNDGACDYHARFNSYDGSHPPYAATWKMLCGEGWADRFISLIEITSTSSTTTVSSTTTSTATSTSTTITTTTVSSTTTTFTTTTRTTTTRTSTLTKTTTSVTETATLTTTATATTTPTTTSSTGTGTTSTLTETDTETETSTIVTTTIKVDTMVLEGACGFKKFLNGMRFVYQGLTANGMPWYKAGHGHQAQYIYYDLDCNGGGTAHPRWVIDDDEPNVTLASDLDEDGTCNYHARLDVHSELGEGPPAVAEWVMFCGEGWRQQRIALIREGEDGQNNTQLFSDTLFLTGACPEKDYLNGLEFKWQGMTEIGAPFYKSIQYDQYIYFDKACDGNVEDTPSRWIIDADAPNTTLEVDLDEDGACDYHARTDNSESDMPPTEATWRMLCGHTWRDVHLFLTDTLPTTTTHEPRAFISGGMPGIRAALWAPLLLLLPALRL